MSQAYEKRCFDRGVNIVPDPMDAGFVLNWLAGPLFLGAWQPLIPGGFAVRELRKPEPLGKKEPSEPERTP